jgi:NADH-quinone oxidoreductase subunit L
LSSRALGFVAGTVAVVTLGFIWAPLIGWTWFERFLVPALPSPLHDAPAATVKETLGLIVRLVVPLTVAAGAWGILVPLLRRRAKVAPGRWERWNATLYVFLLNRGYVDEFYQATVGRPLLSLSRWLSASFEEGVLDRTVKGIGVIVLGIGRRVRVMQSGQLQHYAIAMIVGVILILGVYLVAG